MADTSMNLKDGKVAFDPRLDRVFQLDWRSLDFPVMALMAQETNFAYRSYTHRCDVWNDQGQEGACVGFGWGHELSARPAVFTVDADFSRNRIYKPAQLIDEWPGEDYEGTSVLAGAKIIKQLGLMDSYRWAFTVEEMALAVGYKGPAVIGVNWYTGMFNTDENGFIHPTGRIEGGHCILAMAVRIIKNADKSLNYDASFFTLHNSWGQGWGRLGKAYISFRDMARLIGEQGDVCIPIGRKRQLAASTPISGEAPVGIDIDHELSEDPPGPPEQLSADEMAVVFDREADG
jgi:hypothetical protein